MTTVAQGTYTIDTINAIIPISERNNLFLYRGGLILFFNLCLNYADLASFTDDQCIGMTYCGEFCCLEGERCCPNERMCCGNETELVNDFCGGDMRACPTSLPPNEVYDGNDQLRGHCCVYFRSGCCSESENRTLDLL